MSPKFRPLIARGGGVTCSCASTRFKSGWFELIPSIFNPYPISSKQKRQFLLFQQQYCWSCALSVILGFSRSRRSSFSGGRLVLLGSAELTLLPIKTSYIMLHPAGLFGLFSHYQILATMEEHAALSRNIKRCPGFQCV